jgi:hypothetical protein
VPYGRDGTHEPAILIADTVDDLRTLARADDALTEMFVDSDRDMVGETVTIRGGTGNNIASPK